MFMKILAWIVAGLFVLGLIGFLLFIFRAFIILGKGMWELILPEKKNKDIDSEWKN